MLAVQYNTKNMGKFSVLNNY